jgi:glycosyltransferase involved in cell wall biosynthesis
MVPHGIEAPLDETCRIAPASLRTMPVSGAMLFTAGSIRPARGLEDAIEALSLLSRHGKSARLIIAGEVAGDAARYRQKLDRYIQQSGLSERVCWTGSLTASEMGWCFAQCDAFIMTSRVEACPNTALEAMTYGAVCVSTTNRPMPETFGAGALYYPAGDVRALAECLEIVIDGTAPNRRALSSRAVTRAAEFTWARTARDTVRQLALAAAQR